MLGAVNRTTFYHLVSKVPFDDTLRLNSRDTGDREKSIQSAEAAPPSVAHRSTKWSIPQRMNTCLFVEKNGRLLQPQRIVLRLRLLRNEGGGGAPRWIAASADKRTGEARRRQSGRPNREPTRLPPAPRLFFLSVWPHRPLDQGRRRP
jgi:hypothetical protein